MGHDGHEHDQQHSHAAHQHKSHAPASVSVFVVTSSDSRSLAEDESGRILVEGLERAGHTVAGHRVVRDEGPALLHALEEAESSGARAVIFNGGTGLGRRDVTIETLAPLFGKTLPWFGEISRALSFAQIGSPAMLSRATAGTVRGMIAFALPGSPQAVKLGLERLILPELGHLVREVTR